MQKQKIISILALQATYTDYQLGLFTEGSLVEQLSQDKFFASRDSITLINTLLAKNCLSIGDIDALVVNQGPAPFTSLRVVLTTVNGIAFSSNTPLIGVDGLKVFIKEHSNPNYPYTLALFNAFNNEAYYALTSPEKTELGYKNIEELLHEIKVCYPDITVRCIGSGVEHFKEGIFTILGNAAYIPSPLPAHCSLNSLVEEYLVGHSSTHKQLFPLYLKKPTYKQSTK
jgi:tRNA threonylcarbamoyladenosine biosynthesis protein TsaB